MASLAWAVLKEPRAQIVIICIAGLVPLTLGSLVWISSMHFVVQIILGIVTGVGLMTSHHFMELQRGQARRHEAVKLAQFARLDEKVLRRLLPDSNFPCWALWPQDFEKVRWINAELDEIWPFLKEALSIHVKLKLQSVLHDYKLDSMQSIHIKEISLGRHSPYLSGIKIVEGSKNEIMLEAAVDWRHNEDHHLLLQLQANNQDFILKVMDFMLLGTLKLHFKPLKEQLPGFGAIVLSLGEALIIDLRTKILEGDARNILGIEKQVQNVIWTGLMDLLIWPNRLVIPLIRGEYRCFERKPVGQLKVELLEARELALEEFSGSSDPVLLFYTQRKHDHIKSCSTKCSMSDAVWNDNFVLDVEDAMNQKLTIRLIDSDAPNLDEYVGNAELQINELNRDTVLDLWVNLHGNPSKLKCKGSFGKLHLKVEYKDLSVCELAEKISGGSSVEMRSSMVIEELSVHGTTKADTEIHHNLAIENYSIDGNRNGDKPKKAIKRVTDKAVFKGMLDTKAGDDQNRLKLEAEEKREHVGVRYSAQWSEDGENYDNFHQMDDQECHTYVSEIKPELDENSLEVDKSIYEFADLELDSKMTYITEHGDSSQQPVLLNRDNYGPELFEVD